VLTKAALGAKTRYGSILAKTGHDIDNGTFIKTSLATSVTFTTNAPKTITGNKVTKVKSYFYMSLIDQLQQVAAQINTIPEQLGLVAYKPVLVSYKIGLINYTAPLTPTPRVEQIRPSQVGAFLTPSVEIFPGDLVVSEVTRVQAEPSITHEVLSHATYRYMAKVYKAVHIDSTSDDLFYTIYLRELREHR
jgi:hypothetical protein